VGQGEDRYAIAFEKPVLIRTMPNWITSESLIQEFNGVQNKARYLATRSRPS
jgi:hypothetical protein